VRTYRFEIRLIQFSVLLAVVVLILGLFAVISGSNETEQSLEGANNGTGTVSQPVSEGDTTTSNSSSDSVNPKIVCLGDSFTSGYPGELQDSWPSKLGELLKVEVVNAGKAYQNADDLLERFDEDVVAEKPGKVIILSGIGDALREISLEEYQTNFKALVEKSQANNIVPVIALPLLFPGQEELINTYRQWEIQYGKEKGLVVLDFDEAIFDEQSVIKKEYSDDGKYPNKDGYAAMGDYAARVLK